MRPRAPRGLGLRCGDDTLAFGRPAGFAGDLLRAVAVAVLVFDTLDGGAASVLPVDRIDAETVLGLCGCRGLAALGLGPARAESFG